MFFDPYYWQTAVLIARNGLARLYRNSFLGILWMLFQPLSMALIYSIVMPMIVRSPTTNYVLYVLVSIPVWTFFSSSLIGASNSILANGETLKRCIVSSSVFPIADVLRTSYTFFIAFTTIYVAALVCRIAHPDWHVLLVPVFFIPVMVIIGSMAISLAFTAPYIRDIGDLVNVSMNMLFWFTPVVYQMDMLPDYAKSYMHLNPFFIMLHPIQMLAYGNTLPGWEAIRDLLILMIIAIFIGFNIFRVCRRNYVYYL